MRSVAFIALTGQMIWRFMETLLKTLHSSKYFSCRAIIYSLSGVIQVILLVTNVNGI